MAKQSKWHFDHNPLTNRANSNWDKDVANMFENNNTYFAYFSTIAMNLFEWKNLPPTCNADFLEFSLFVDGRACMVKDNTLGLLNLRYTENGVPNIYLLPSVITAYSNGYTQNFTSDNFEICRNNIQYLPTAIYVEHFTNIISEIESTARVNLKAQKTPVLLTGDKEQIVQIENTLAKLESNSPYIIAKQDFTQNVNLSVLKTDAPFIADRLTMMKEQYKNEFFSFLGINNADEKKERLLTDEVNANNQFISLNFETMYNERKKFAKNCNDKFGTNIQVEPRVRSVILENERGNASAEDRFNIESGVTSNG